MKSLIDTFLYLVKKAIVTTVNVSDYKFEIDNSARKNYADSEKIMINKPVVEALENVRLMLPAGYNLIIKDGLRTFDEQLRIVQQEAEKLKKDHPDNWDELPIGF